MPEESASIVALTLVRIDYIDDVYGNREKVAEVLRLAGEIVDCSGKNSPLPNFGMSLVTHPQEPHSRMTVNRGMV